MKKLIVFITIALLIFGISACSPANKGDDASTIDKITDLSNKNDTTKTDSKEKVKLNPDEPSDPTDLPEPEEEEFTATLSPFEEKIERAKSLFESLLEKEYKEELYFSVFSDDDEVIVIQLFSDAETELGQKIEAFEEDFATNGTLNSENQAEWDAIIETFYDFCAQIKADFPDFKYFQILSHTDDQVRLQINKDLLISNFFVK